jgi:hypothetical protein
MLTSLVITTINKPNKIINKLSVNSKINKWNLVIVGDKKTPKNFNVEYGKFVSLKDQLHLNFKFSKICPHNNYARKNIGYLIAMQNSEVILETDDDNLPYDSFFKKRKIAHITTSIKNNGWVNIYDLFVKKKHFIWPRGIPLDELNNKIKLNKTKKKFNFLIQQGLCNKNPDVDSIYRLMNEKINVNFKNFKVNLGNSLSTFNSQNTTWFKEVFPLMYLPSTCTMRCTDIWRSIVALKIMNLNKKNILFHNPTMKQFRNPHDLIKDFIDEIPMYENTKHLYNSINKLRLKKGKKNYFKNLNIIYKKLVNLKILQKQELEYLRAWTFDCNKIITNTS